MLLKDPDFYDLFIQVIKMVLITQRFIIYLCTVMNEHLKRRNFHSLSFMNWIFDENYIEEAFRHVIKFTDLCVNGENDHFLSNIASFNVIG